MVLPAPLGPMTAIRSRPWTVELDVAQQRVVPAGGHAAQRRHQPAPAAALELDLERCRVARLLDVGLGVELLLEPPLA